MSTIFSKIIAREAPSDIVFQDERVTAFKDISPQAPVHILIVPNKAIPTANDVTEADEAVLGHMLIVAKQIAAEQGVAADGYRLIINCNQHGGQEVYHLHMHLLGGRPLGPMLTRRYQVPSALRLIPVTSVHLRGRHDRLQLRFASPVSTGRSSRAPHSDQEPS